MNAIILASGLGSRLRPYTDTTPKPLLEVKGLPIIEHTIKHLNNAGCGSITIVVGYMKDKFEYLMDKYDNVELIHNDKYEEHNNWYSLYLASDRLGTDTFIIDGDLYIRRNIFLRDPNSNYYFVSNRPNNTNEWKLLLDSDCRVIDYELVEEHYECYVHSSASHWNESGCNEIKRILKLVNKDTDRVEAVWDDYMIRMFENIDIYTKVITIEDAIELDTVSDYEEVL